MIPLQYLSSIIFQSMEKAAWSIILYLLFGNIFHKLHAKIYREENTGASCFSFPCSWYLAFQLLLHLEKVQLLVILKCHCYVANPFTSAVHQQMSSNGFISHFLSFSSLSFSFSLQSSIELDLFQLHMTAEMSKGVLVKF